MIQCFWLQILKIWLEISPDSNFDLCILLQTGINAGQRSDKSMTRRVEAKKGGIWANLWAAIFSKPKGICNWFFLCVHSTYRWTYIVWIWAKSEGVTWHPVVHLAWNDPHAQFYLRGCLYKVQQFNDARFSSITCCTILKYWSTLPPGSQTVRGSVYIADMS